VKDGVVEIGNGAFCYLQDTNRGSGWGWSNSGLLVDSGEALLVDTLRDENLTNTMLNAYLDATGLRPKDIGTLVNTHHDGDHTYGNRLMEHARIMATKECAEMLAKRPPSMLQNLLDNRPQGELGDFLFSLFGPPFDFKGLQPTLPTDYVADQQEIKVGNKTARIIGAGPAHTVGDIMVYVPEDRIVYTGDIVFFTNTPVLWAGPSSNWVKALDTILAMDVDTVVPGHGPITDKSGVAKTREYLVYVEQESRKRFDAGLSMEEAIQDISLGEFESWGGVERIVVNVDHHYARFRGEEPTHDLGKLMALMAPYALRARRKRGGASPEIHPPTCDCGEH
jgi:cyclase